jgi:hypothetical protein
MSDEIRDLREHAEQFRQLARVVEDERNRQRLLDMAKGLDAGADALARTDRSKR